MIYYANGCSFTWGGGLYNFSLEDGTFLHEVPDHPVNQERLQKVYSYHLGKKINAKKVINQSLAGGSNHRIVRTTLEYFNNLICNGEKIDNHFVTIQWSEPSRYEYYNEIEKTWMLLSAHNAISENMVPNISYLKIQQNYYKNFYTTAVSFHNFVQHVYVLGNFFRVNKIPYLFFKHAAWDMPFYVEKLVDREKYFKIFGQFNWLNDDPLDYNMYGSGIERVNNDSHPSELGHKQWANIVYRHIEKKKLIKLNSSSNL